jgi:hypothetical protein
MLLHVGGVAVSVRSASPAVNALQRAFYTAHPAQDATADWVIDAIAAPAPDGVPVNPFGVGYTAEPAARTLTLWSPDEQDLAITTRKCVREVFLNACEQRRYTMLHAAAIHRDGHVVVFAADKRGGKTTLALRGVLEHGWGLLANDHLIVHPAGGGLSGTSLPTPIPVKVGTLVDLADRLPAPWDGNGVDVGWWRAQQPDRRYASDLAAFYTFGDLGQPNPVHVPLTPGHVTVVFPRYADRTGPLHDPETVPAAAAAAELGRHVRLDWAGTARTDRHLPCPARDLDAVVRDGATHTAELAATARTLRWAHHGDPARLLAALPEAAR